MTLFAMIISPAQCEHALTPFNNNQSIYFDKISNMHLVRDEWKLIVYYNMDPYQQGLELFEKYINHLDKICMQIQRKTQCDVALLQLRHSMTELEYYNCMLLGQQPDVRGTRHRRGLINGVGYVARSLFGVLDDEFAEQYKKDIQLLRDNQKHLALLWRNQTSVVEGEYNLLKRVEEAMDKQHKRFNQHINYLEKAANSMRKDINDLEIMNDFIMSSTIANSILANLKSIQETLLDTITDTHNGMSNIHLLTPEQIRNELNIISGQISKELTIPIENIQADLHNLYHLLKIRAKMTKEYFIFEIKIPMITRDTFEIYKIIPIPQQVKNDMVTLVPVADYLAINIHKDSYLPMTLNDVQRCLQYDMVTHLCQLQRPIYNMKSDDNLCIKDQALNHCKTKTERCENRWIELSKINNYLFFCCGQCTIRIICGHQVTAERLRLAGIISVSNDCVIKDEHFTIFSHKQQSNEIKMQPEIIKVEVPSINNIINISMPITSFESDFKDHQTQLKNIEQQINQMKAESGQIDEISYHHVHHYVVIYLLVGAAAVGGASYAWWRVCRARRRSARLAHEQQGQQARQAPAPVPPPRAPLIDSVSASVQCVNNHQCAIKPSASDAINDSSARINKITTPVFTKTDFNEIRHL